MTKENILFSVVGILLGFIVGFFFANSINQRAPAPRAEASANADGALPPGHPNVSVNSVKEQSNLQPAADEAARKAEAAPSDFDAQMSAAELNYKANNYDKALDFLLRANQLRPEDTEVVVALGNVNYDAGNYETAEKWYTAALLKKPDDVNVRTDLGLTFLLRKPSDPERAIAEFRRSLERDPEHELTLQNMSAALIHKGDLTEAASMLERLAKINAANPQLPALRADLERARGTANAATASPTPARGRK